ncbi:MAG: hypothetical protein IJD78_08395 [Clostridia bacterium]|nr:hypothetical protein [Clostridia bacterium]
MKKTVSMLLAVLMAAIAVCTFGVSAFADETTTVAANDDPTDAFVTVAPTTAAPTTAAATTAAPATTAAATTAAATTAAATTAAATTAAPSTTKSVAEKQSELDAEETVTRDPSKHYIEDDETTAAPATTKKPAKVESNIPSTGSTVVPVIALLALAAGTVAVVKTKKED